jgi:hypothetical protein
MSDYCEIRDSRTSVEVQRTKIELLQEMKILRSARGENDLIVYRYPTIVGVPRF